MAKKSKQAEKEPERKAVNVAGLTEAHLMSMIDDEERKVRGGTNWPWNAEKKERILQGLDGMNMYATRDDIIARIVKEAAK